jgi:hypothetical protein
VGCATTSWTLVVTLLAWGVPGLAAQPGGQSAQLMVTARVLERASVRVVSQPDFVEVSDEDIRRRYVDVGAPVKVEVTSNLPRGMHLTFDVSDESVGSAQVRTTQRQTQLPTRGSMRTEVIEVHLRLALTERARAGRHAWPVQISTVPL